MSATPTSEVRLDMEAKSTKALVERFKSLAIGTPCVFPTPFPGLSAEACQVVLRERTVDGTFWEFALFWHGCDMGAVFAEVKENQLVLDML